MAVSILGLFAAVLAFGSLDAGWSWGGLWGGLPRVGFAFVAGMLIERSGILKRARPSWWMVAPILILTAMLCIEPPENLRGAIELACVILGFPLLVIAGGIWEAPKRLRGVCEKLGLLSYPLYATHAPLLFLATPAAKYGGRVGVVAFFAAVVALAYVLGRYIDPPVRRWLNARSLAMRPQQAPC